MIATLVSLLIAAFIIFNPFLAEGQIEASALARVVGYIAIPFLFFLPFCLAMTWLPLQKAERNITPRVLDMFSKDRWLRFACVWLLVFPLLSLFLAFIISSVPPFGKALPFAVWIALFGLALDAAYYFVRKVLSYLNPYAVASMFTQEAKKSIQDERSLDLCEWIDALSEVSLKSIQEHSIALCNTTLDEQGQIARLFLNSSKSISHRTEDKQSQAMGIADEVSYTMFYLYQRLDMAFDSALKKKLEPVCSHIISILGKIAVDAAKYDITIASPPLRFLGKFSARAQADGLEEVPIKASCLLLEIAKVILEEIDVTYLEIKDPFLSIINNLEEMSKTAFRRDKSISIPLLIQPFLDLKELFKGEKIAAHQDAPVIMQNIDRVLGEFQALQMVMNTLPVIPTISEDEIKPTGLPATIQPTIEEKDVKA